MSTRLLSECLGKMSPEDRLYFLENIAIHLAGRSRIRELYRLLMDYGFIEAKTSVLGTQPLIVDYEYVKEGKDRPYSWRKTITAFNNADLTGTDFTLANLEAANFAGATLEDVQVWEANLSNIRDARRRGGRLRAYPNNILR